MSETKTAGTVDDSPGIPLGSEFGDGTRETHLFNGRPLTAEDARADRMAVADRLARLGLAVGPGVATGLWVTTPGADRITVEAGVGVSARGETLRLGRTVTLALRGRSSDEAVKAADFSACVRDDGEVEEAPSASYLLVASRTSEHQGQVPRVLRGTAGEGPTGCGRRWEVEGVAFELLPLPASAPGGGGGGDEAADPRLRNRLAYWCYQGPGPGAPDFRRGREGLDEVEGLTDGHVPLAALYRAPSGDVTVDVWAARRTPGPPLADGVWRAFVPGGQARTGLARFLGFQANVAGVSLQNEAAAFSARERLRWLPPAGLVPMRPASGAGGGSIPEWVTSGTAGLDVFLDLGGGGGSGGGASTAPSTGRLFDPARFFQGLPVAFRGLASAEEARLAVERSWRADPWDLDAPGEGLDIYVLPPSSDSLGAVLENVRRHRVNRSSWGGETYFAYDDLTAGWRGSGGGGPLGLILAGLGVAGGLGGAGGAVTQGTGVWLLFVRRVRDLFTVSVPREEGAVVDDDSSEAPDVSAPATGSVSGRVTVEGQGVAGVTLALQPLFPDGTEATVTTAGNGSFGFSQVAPGNYLIKGSQVPDAFFPPHGTPFAHFTVTAGAEASVAIQGTRIGGFFSLFGFSG